MRDATLRGAVLFGVSLVVITEILSAAHLLRRGPLLAVWTALLLLAAVRLVGRRDRKSVV